MTEEFYITKLNNGDERAFRYIFDMFNIRLCYFATGFLKHPEDAKDVVQDAFVKLWQHKENFDKLISIQTFLYITVKNACLNITKHNKVVDRYQNSVIGEKNNNIQEDEIVRHLIETEVFDKVYNALQKLPRGCRNVLQLSYFHGLKNKEVANQLHVSINTVKTQKRIGLSMLRSLLG